MAGKRGRLTASEFPRWRLCGGSSTALWGGASTPNKYSAFTRLSNISSESELRPKSDHFSGDNFPQIQGRRRFSEGVANGRMVGRLILVFPSVAVPESVGQIPFPIVPKEGVFRHSPWSQVNARSWEESRQSKSLRRSVAALVPSSFPQLTHRPDRASDGLQRGFVFFARLHDLGGDAAKHGGFPTPAHL